MKGMGGSKRSVSDGCILTWYIHVVETHRNEKKICGRTKNGTKCATTSPRTKAMQPNLAPILIARF